MFFLPTAYVYKQDPLYLYIYFIKKNVFFVFSYIYIDIYSQQTPVYLQIRHVPTEYVFEYILYSRIHFAPYEYIFATGKWRQFPLFLKIASKIQKMYSLFYILYSILYSIVYDIHNYLVLFFG